MNYLEVIKTFVVKYKDLVIKYKNLFIAAPSSFIGGYVTAEFINKLM